MTTSDKLKTDIDRAHQHLTRCRNELTRFCSYGPEGTDSHERTRRKLAEDVRKAERDLAYARHAFDRYLTEMGMARPGGE